MKISIVRTISCTGLLLLMALLGCSRDDKPPPPLAVEQIPVELDKAFKSGPQQARDLVAKVTASLQKKDFPAAYDAVHALSSLPDASRDQRALASRAELSVYGLLQTAQAQGDENAAAAVRFLKSTK